MAWRVRPMRILLALLIVLGVVLSASTADARKRKKFRPKPVPYVERHASIVLEADSGRLLYEKWSHATRYPASLTKMMTLYLLFEQLQRGQISLSSTLVASNYACSQDPTRLGLRPGDTLTVEEAIKALVVRSANDVAVMVAERLGGSEYAFASRMTAKAREMGMAATVFVNASGLPDTSQRSTAWDLSILTRRLVHDFPQFYPYFRLQSFYWNGRSFEGHNHLLKFFDGADGLKTGYTRMSGFNLASSATRQGKRLIAVVMGGRSARDRDIQTAELLEANFNKLGLGRPAPVIMAMSPVVLDDEEAQAADESESASSFRPGSSATTGEGATSSSSGQSPVQAGSGQTNTNAQVAQNSPYATIGQGDTSDQIRQPVPATHGQWGIQVGAHLARDKAETQLRQVLSRSRDIIGHAKSAIVELDVRGEIFYRVRFGSFTPAKAESLCAQLQKRGTSCLVVTDGAWDQASSRASLPIAVR